MSNSDDLQIEDWFSAVINEQRPERDIDKTKLGAIFDKRMNRNNTLSDEQIRLSQSEVKGHPMLIRGVVGSGKTVVLANMVASYIHRNISEPEDMFEGVKAPARIAVICFNRCLVPFIKRKIIASYREKTGYGFSCNSIMISHYNGLFIHIFGEECQQIPDTNYIPISHVPDKIMRANMYREQFRILAKKYPEVFEKLLYDAIFVDEGQDLSEEDYKLLLDITKKNVNTNEKSLIIFYDDAQNLYAMPRPVWKQIGIDMLGHSKVLRKCHRSPLEIVELGFNVLLGSKASIPPSGIREFSDVKYLKRLGLVEETDGYCKVNFARKRSRKPEIHTFNTREEEMQFVSDRVLRLIERGKVRPEDILILFHQSEEFKDLDGIIKEKKTTEIDFHFPHLDENKDEYIFRKNHITISTIRSAKGYDAPIVFLMGADLLRLDNPGRASFYVGATRARYILIITGLNKPDTLLAEAEALLRS